MTLSELEQALFNLWPRRYAAAWDNVGMQAGDPAAPVRKVLVALDVTDGVAGEAERLGADAVINIRYGSSSVMQGAAEVIAYGTAVKYR